MLGVLFGVSFMLAGAFTLRNRPSHVFAVFLLMFVMVVVQINLNVLPPCDTRRPDRLFLMILQEHLPPQPLLFAIGGPGIARHIVYVQIPLIGVWNPEDIGKYLGEEKIFLLWGAWSI